MDDRIKLRRLLTIGIVLTGLCSYYGKNIHKAAAKFQNRETVEEQCPSNIPPQKHFYHPFVQVFISLSQTLLMFFGELLCLPLFYLHKSYNKRQYSLRLDFARVSGRKRPKMIVYLLPATCDMIASLLDYTSITILAGSTYQLLNNGRLITTSIFSYAFTKVPLKRNEKWGGGIAFIALVFAALAVWMNEYDSADPVKQYTWVGVGLMVAAILFRGLHLSFEQKMFHQYHVEPIQLVGFQGFFGTIFSFLGLLVASRVQCPFTSVDSCVCVGGQLRLDNALTYLGTLKVSIVLLSIAIILSTSAFNMIGVHLTKDINALGRCISTSSRSIFVWIIGLFLNLIDPGDQFESTDWKVLLVKSCAFVGLLVAVLIYNRLIFAERDTPKYLLSNEQQHFY